MQAIYKKLLEVQKEIKAIAKDSVNPHFKNRYFDINTLIAELKPVLNKHGLVVMQPLQDSTLKTLVVDADSGEELSWSTALPEVTDPQKFGAAITYFRRYALTSLFLLEAEDDDGESAKSEVMPAKSETKKCPKCGKDHQGKYAKCIDCWKAENNAI